MTTDCSGCKLAKFSALHFPRSISHFVAQFDLVNSDVWGSALIATKGGSSYYVSFIDDYSPKVPSEFWGEAALIAVSLINKIPSFHNSALSPFEILKGHSSDYSSLRVFGCTCFVLHLEVELSKLTSRSAICVFLVYGQGQKGYCCFDPINNKLYVSRHVMFLEHIPFFSISDNTHDITKIDLIHIDPFFNNINSPLFHTVCTVDSLSPTGTHALAHDTPLASMASQAPPEVVNSAPAPSLSRYPQRIRKSIQLSDFAYSCYSKSLCCFLTSIHKLSEPSSYKKAILDPLW
ncbi:uncharacterized protein LOC111392423 [Olea europaea var. sylvestris]|uniref:uncharacterized protein LOC111392423 n=1 Tax=Olea europaea var. sylvestris TaxID=158386 RepID=UPI000C1CD90C|nr:uncharacterized protein LOC111392423 [Olea europaea var. sylvestris]